MPIPPLAPSAFSWTRLLRGIATGSFVALGLAWIVAPQVASSLTSTPLDQPPTEFSDAFLVCDTLLSFGAFLVGSLLSWRLARTHPYMACLAVSAVGTLVYLWAMQGGGGMFDGAYPLWYELAPIHLGSGALAVALARRTNTHNAGHER